MKMLITSPVKRENEINERTVMFGMTISDNRLVYSNAVDTPAPAADEVLIRVAYAGVNRADIFQVEGNYAPPEGASPLPGLEVSGEIIAIGSDVTDWKIGDTVCALLTGGGYAEYATAKASHCLPLPEGVSLKEAATLPEVYATIWMALMDIAQMKTGEKLLVHGGSSGVGSAAIQWAKQLGVHVFSTARTPEKCVFIEQLGGSAINYSDEDFVNHIKTAGGVDIVLDMVGGDYITRNMKCLNRYGRLVSLALLKGAAAEVSAGSLLLKNLSWHGATLRARDDSTKTAYIATLREQVWPHFASGALRPVCHETFPLKDAEKAHSLMRESLHCGKIALQVCPA